MLDSFYPDDLTFEKYTEYIIYFLLITAFLCNERHNQESKDWYPRSRREDETLLHCQGSSKAIENLPKKENFADKESSIEDPPVDFPMLSSIPPILWRQVKPWLNRFVHDRRHLKPSRRIIKDLESTRRWIDQGPVKMVLFGTTKILRLYLAVVISTTPGRNLQQRYREWLEQGSPNLNLNIDHLHDLVVEFIMGK